MKKANIKTNYFYNLAYQLFAMITPLITTPYVSRVLSSDGIGQFTFSSSIISYFSMFASLGFAVYAQREIAKYQGDKEKQSVVFREILICKAISGAVCLIVCWLMIVLGLFQSYTLLVAISSVEIVSVTLNISFFFQGNENFRIIAIRDFAVRSIGVSLIFLFVKSKDDLWIYALCMAGTTLLSALSLWPYMKKDILKCRLSQLRPARHILPAVRLFIPTIAISVFMILDKTLIGILIPGDLEICSPDGTTVIKHIADIENGYYGQSEKIIQMSLMVLASLGTVMLPRNARELEKGRQDIFFRNITHAIEFVFFIGAPISAGLMAIASNFSPWFFGEGYEKVPVLMVIFAFIVIPSGLGNVFGKQYLIPKGEDRKYTLAYVSSAVVNLILNILLIPKYLSYGAAVASVIAEIIAPAIMLWFIRKSISPFQIIQKNWKPLVSAAAMFVCVYLTGTFLEPSIISTIVLISEGILIYTGSVLILKTPIAYEAYKIARNKIAVNRNV